MSVAARSRMVAYVGIFTGFYLLYALPSGAILGQALHGADVHIPRAFLMALLAAKLGRAGGPTLMGVVSGLILFFVPGPSALFLLPASILAGLTYDLILKGRDYATNARNRVRVLTGSGMEGLVESAVVMAGLSAIGLFGPLTPGMLALIWTFELATNLVLSLVGAALAIAVLRTRPRFFASG